MASRSGSKQTLEIAAAGTTSYRLITGADTGFDSMDVTEEPSTFEETSGGQTTTESGGHIVVTGSFSTGASAAAEQELLGRNGRRAQLRWRKQGAGSGLQERTGEAILEITRTFNGRGREEYSVECYFDGGFPETTQ